MHRTLDRNFVLQKQLERSCKRLEREFKTSQRKTQSVAEACAAFTYRLLYEATIKEKENLRNRPKSLIPTDTTITCLEDKKENAPVRSSLVRPLTAQVGRDNNRRNQKRPSSAHPLIPSDNTSADDKTLDGESNASKTSRKQSFSKKNTSQNNDKDGQKDNKHIGTKRNSTSAKSVVSYVNNENTKRPQTADFYRKKQPESELAMFWSKRVHAVISKWDEEDSEWNISESKPRDIPLQAWTLTPPIKGMTLTEPERKLKAFVRRFGQKYRTQMGPVSPTTTLIGSGGRKNFTISTKELASIHAERSRRLKNTQIILKKSEKLHHIVERYSEVKDV